MRKTVFNVLLIACLSFSTYASAAVTTTVTATAGGLSAAIKKAGYATSAVTGLTINGTIDARDFKMMRDSMALLQNLDMTNASIASYTGLKGPSLNTFYATTYPANTIPEFAFAFSLVNSTSLVSVKLPNTLTMIDGDGFAYCMNLTSVTLPSSLKIIGSAAFSGCSSLPSISIPTSVDSIADHAFMGCYMLTSLTIPSGVTTLSGWICCSCSSLSTVTLPSTIKTIGDSAFYKCLSLQSIVLPTTVSSIGIRAFYNCTSLTSITAKRPVAVDLTASDSVFGKVNTKTCALHVLSTSASSYSTAKQWKDFTISADIVGINNIQTDKLKILTANGSVVISGLTEGISFAIYNLQGSAIYNQKADAQTVSVNLPAKGVYVLRVGGESVKFIY
ncbi:MAG: leucine-rich repeat domain-containing protein [Paludibacteraceae bacterium]|nr:leucine-rich repeat domain-containing protein [Paludibacteraceae bacterium]